MKLKKNTLLCLAVIIIFNLSSCQKEFSVEVTPNNQTTAANDTSMIITLVEYQYFNGTISDSIIYTIKNATLNGDKKIKLSAQVAAGDSLFALYSYNNQNQLTEILYTNNYDLTDISKNVITWNGNNVSRIQYDSTGATKYKYDFTYSTVANKTKITYARTPNTNLFIIYFPNSNTVNYLTDYKSEFEVDPSFVPSSLYFYSHGYIDNGGGSIPSNRWDSSRTDFNFSADSNLVNATSYGVGRDTGVNNTPGTGFYTDTITLNYTRSNADNMTFTNILKNIYGTKLYTLSSYFDTFLDDYLLAGADEIKQFNNKVLSTRAINQIVWYNGIKDTTANSPIVDIKFINSFDAKNRLVSYTRFESAPIFTTPVYAFKIIYP